MQQEFYNYDMCKEKDSMIDYSNFQKIINTTKHDSINFTLFGFDRSFPLFINVSETQIKLFDVSGIGNNQFVHFYGSNENINIKSNKATILFQKTKVRLKSLSLYRSIIYSPNGKIDLFADSLISDGFSLKKHFFSRIQTFSYILTSRAKPSAKITVLRKENEQISILNIENQTKKAEEEQNFTFNNSEVYSNSFKSFNKSKFFKPKLLENREEFLTKPFPVSSEFPQYINDHIQYLNNDINNDNVYQSENRDEEDLISSDVRYCLCMKSRLDRCKENQECDSYVIPLSHYVTGKEDWFKSDISHSNNRTIRLYVTGTEGLTMNIGFEDFLGKNNTVYFNLVNPNWPAYLSISGKYMSSSSSQIGVFSAVFNNINRVFIDSDIVDNLNDITLKQSPLFIRPSHRLTIRRLITDTRSISQFEGTLYIEDLLILNNSEPVYLDGTLFLQEGCLIYVPQVSLFPNIFLNDEYILFSDKDEDNDLVLYFADSTDSSKKWTLYLSNDILIENDLSIPSINISLKTSSQSTIPVLFVFDIRMKGMSLYFDDISKLSNTIEFEIVAPESIPHYLEIQIDYTESPVESLFKKIEGNIDLVLLTSKTIQYFLNSNSVLFGLHSLTFYVFDSMTKILFQEESTSIFFGSDSISFHSSQTNSIQVISENNKELEMSIVPGSTKIFPLNLMIINDNATILFDSSFSFLLDEGINDGGFEFDKSISIYHDDLNINLVSSELQQIPLLTVDNSITGVLFNTSTEMTYNIEKNYYLSQYLYRSGPKVTANIVGDDVEVFQSSFLASEVKFTGKPFAFIFFRKSRCSYTFQNEVQLRIVESNENVEGESNQFKSDVNNENKSNLFKSAVNIKSESYLFKSAVNIKSESNLFKSVISENSGIASSDGKLIESAALLDEENVAPEAVSFQKMVITEKGKLAQSRRVKLVADFAEIMKISSIDESNFEGPISINSNFVTNDNSIRVIEFTENSLRIIDSQGKTAYLLQAAEQASFEVIYTLNPVQFGYDGESEAYIESCYNRKSGIDKNKDIQTITLKVLDKKTEILKNFKLTAESPVSLFFDSSWYNVTNTEDLVINASADITLRTDLLKMLNFTVLLSNSAKKEVEIKKPKHTSKIAFYTFLGLSVPIFIICAVFCFIDYCHRSSSDSVEIDLNSSSSECSSEEKTMSSISSMYEYYTYENEEEEEEEEGDGKEKKPDDKNDQPEKNLPLSPRKSIIITSYGNTTKEWRDEHLRKRRKKNHDSIEEEEESDKKKKKKKKSRKERKLEKKMEKEKENLMSFEEVYYESS